MRRPDLGRDCYVAYAYLASASKGSFPSRDIYESKPMKLNMGCGHNKKPGYVNVDCSPVCGPDLVYNLEALPWPWDNDSIAEVLFNHTLEHLGEDSHTFLEIMKELYRVCKHGAEIKINVPHPRHDSFINDPTHVRVITPELLRLFDREACDEWQRLGGANTPLAHYLDVDFRVAAAKVILNEPYSSRFARGELSAEAIDTMARELNNVFVQYQIVLVARKK